MIRTIPFVLAGAVIGGVLTWSVSGSSGHSTPPPGPPLSPLACDAQEITRLKLRVAQLEDEKKSAVSHSATPLPGIAAEESHEVGEAGAAISSQDTVSWRVSAIEKFVPLNPEQKERLREKYERESTASANGEEVQSESLEDIIGSENASYYREQVQAAFKRVQNEEIERESVWLTRKLGLSPEQESSVRQIFERVESEVSESTAPGHSSGTPQERVRALIAENQRRSELRTNELSNILSPEQRRAYAELEAESSASDVEVFHDPGAAAATPGANTESR